MPYCRSRYRTVRRPTLEVRVGSVGVGGDNPIRIQSMTTSDTQDVDATLRQSIALAEVGCEIVRITAPNVAAARCLGEIRRKFTQAGFGAIPLVADIHFLPQAAMEAVEHVEKVRVNPGNYADKKRFDVREYSDAEYQAELERIAEKFSPLVLRCKELGRALRIGTNHGSLSDRIMNRYGDTPLGMVESALEFLRIGESHGFRQMILSMKASNPKVMIQAYRMLVERMDREGMRYPLHLGVTEAGDGEDGRIKSAIGIGSLLLDGLGDTIRVSLTEDSVYEVPVARAIADKAMSLWTGEQAGQEPDDGVDPYRFSRRQTGTVLEGSRCRTSPGDPPRVVVRASLSELPGLAGRFQKGRLADAPLEGVLVGIAREADLDAWIGEAGTCTQAGFHALELSDEIDPQRVQERLAGARLGEPLVLLRRFAAAEAGCLADFTALAARIGAILACDIAPADLPALAQSLRARGAPELVLTLSRPTSAGHGLGSYRALARAAASEGLRIPIWVRCTEAFALRPDSSFLSRLLDASILAGGLICDGVGDWVSVESEADPVRAHALAYNVLQGAGARISKTEFVACPSCGRTLFDLQSTTRRIRAKTGHLTGVKIAVMGCIVNGPGEMADADFGYVGGAPGKINLYVGKTCVEYHVPQQDADTRLIELIRTHGKWRDPEPPQI